MTDATDLAEFVFLDGGEGDGLVGDQLGAPFLCLALPLQPLA